MRRLLILIKANLLIHLRTREVLFWNFAFPIFLLVIYELVFGRFSVGHARFLDWVVPGVVVLNALSFGLIGSSTMLLEMREKGVLRRLQATPLPAWQLVTAQLAVHLAVSLLQTALVVLAGIFLLGAAISAGAFLLALPAVLVANLAFVALGQVIGAAAPKAGTALAIGQIIYFALMFISDMIMPLEMMPEWIQALMPYLPSYAAAQLVRPPLMQGEWAAGALTHLGLLTAYTLTGALLAARLFRWEPRT